MSNIHLVIGNKNYSSWSLRGWLLCKMAGLDFDETVVSSDDPSTRAELLLLSPSFLVPCLTHDGVKVWDTLAIGEYLNEIKPGAGLLPADPVARANWLPTPAGPFRPLLRMYIPNKAVLDGSYEMPPIVKVDGQG